MFEIPALEMETTSKILKLILSIGDLSPFVYLGRETDIIHDVTSFLLKKAWIGLAVA